MQTVSRIATPTQASAGNHRTETRFGNQFFGLPELPRLPQINLGANLRQVHADILDLFPGLRTTLGKYGGSDNLEAGFAAMSPRAQRYIDKMLASFLPEGTPGVHPKRKLSPSLHQKAFKLFLQEANAYEESQSLGLMEEASDMLFELYTLQALRNKLITPNLIAFWVEDVQRRQVAGEPFHDTLRAIYASLPEDSVKRFSKLSDIPEERAKPLLGLIVFKFAMYKSRHPGLDFEADTLPRMEAEARELIAHFPPDLPERQTVLGLAFDYRDNPDQSTEKMRDDLLDVVNKRLKGRISYDEMVKYIFIKQLGRQELDYDNPGLTYNMRKSMIKPYELLLETYILRESRVKPQHPPCEKRAAVVGRLDVTV